MMLVIASAAKERWWREISITGEGISTLECE